MLQAVFSVDELSAAVIGIELQSILNKFVYFAISPVSVLSAFYGTVGGVLDILAVMEIVDPAIHDPAVLHLLHRVGYISTLIAASVWQREGGKNIGSGAFAEEYGITLIGLSAQ